MIFIATLWVTEGLNQVTMKPPHLHLAPQVGDVKETDWTSLLLCSVVQSDAPQLQINILQPATACGAV